VALVGLRIALVAWAVDRHGRTRPAHEGRARGLPLLARDRQRWDRPAFGHGHGQRAPGAVARGGKAERRPVERQLIALSGPVVDDDRDDGQRSRSAGIDDEGLDELDSLDPPSLGTEPAGGGEQVGVKGGDRRRDGRPIDGDG
jgi:hypothetical protein